MNITKLILFVRDTLTGRINSKMLRYHISNRFRKPSTDQRDDDFDWTKYSLHYEGELELGQKTRTLCLNPGDYEFSNGELVKQRPILSLHPNVQLLYETILQLSPDSVLEIGCGGGDNLHNLHVLRPLLQIMGRDISDDQLNLLRTRHDELSSHVGKLDITKYSPAANSVDLVFTQAVIMHIGSQQLRHVTALKNLFKAARRYVVLMENWSKHSFLDDINTLMQSGDITWPECNLYYRQHAEDPAVKLLVASSTPLGYLPLTDYASLLGPR